jgi:hypothetical protein
MSNFLASAGKNIINNNDKSLILKTKSSKSSYNPKNYNEIIEYSDEDDEENLDNSKTTAQSNNNRSNIILNKNRKKDNDM